MAQGPSFRKIRRNEPILLDYVFAWKGYISDHTRIFVIGRPPRQLVEAHHHMLDLQERDQKPWRRRELQPADLYSAAVEIAARKGSE